MSKLSGLYTNKKSKERQPTNLPHKGLWCKKPLGVHRVTGWRGIQFGKVLLRCVYKTSLLLI